MHSPVRNGKSVMRSLRIPYELDEQIRQLCARHSLNYSLCVIRLARNGMNNNDNDAGQDASQYKALDEMIASIL